MSDTPVLIAAARRAVSDACAVCRQVQRGLDRLRAITKDDLSPVTIADFASQAVVAHVLSQRLGRIRLVAEETSDFLRQDEHILHLEAAVAAAQEVWPDVDEAALLDAIDLGAGDAGHAAFWTLDPIDGTKGFLRNQQYAVCLAYVELGTPTIGVLGCPNLARDFNAPLDKPDPHGSLYLASRGDGAYELPCDEPDAHPVRLTRPQRPANALLILARSVESAHSDISQTDRIAELLGPVAPPLRLDSQCKYALVARAQADAYIRVPRRADYAERIWDHAAGAVIAAEAGCAVTDIRSHPLDFSRGRGLDHNRGIVCAPPAVHGRIIGAIAQLGIDPP